MPIDALIINSPYKASPLQVLRSYVQPILPVNYEPLQAASVLEEAGFEVKFLPLENIFPYFSPKTDILDAEKLISNYEAEVVIFYSSLFLPGISNPTYPFDIYFAEYLKKINTNVKIILAGSHASYLPVESLQDSQAVDAIALFECEEILPRLVKTYQTEKVPENIKGVVYRNEKNSIVNKNFQINTVDDISLLPIPSYHLLKEHLKDIIHSKDKIDLLIMTSRGCSFRCAFCASVRYSKKLRFRSAELIGNELDRIEAIFGKSFRIFSIMDNNFTLNQDHMIRVCKEFIDREIAANMFLSNATTFNSEIAKYAANFCNYVYFGAESSLNKILSNVKKPQTFEEVTDACFKAKKAGLKTILNFIIGLPHEDTLTMSENLTRMIKTRITGLVDNVSCSILVPYPGTDLYQHPEKYNIEILHKEWDSYGEAGYPPVYRTQHLSNNQIFYYYLLASLINQFLPRKGILREEYISQVIKYITLSKTERLKNSLDMLMEELNY